MRGMRGNIPGSAGAHKMVSALDLLHLCRAAADRAAEGIVAEVLLAAEPGSRVVGEELAPDLVTDGLVWIVDPLDGTTNFLHGFPSYAVSIAASLDGKLLAGVVLDVPSSLMYWAADGAGAWQGDKRLEVS